MIKERFTIEYDMKRAPVMLLWNHIATPPGLSQWFADKVIQNGKTIDFTWKGSTSQALILGSRLGNYARYRWNDDYENEKVYFEMRISTSEITDSTTLIITDFAEDEDDKKSTIELWNHQIENLQRLLGCL
ncbi:MAG: START-like domain-containing protein [Muribaculaceae bacterium]|nr:START-like domain-containing protein [Muribaculaceae bacterium]